ncbi:MAG: LuxR C-terminal-related transcriptional regulator [Candidatus Thiodiazotropha sp.]
MDRVFKLFADSSDGVCIVDGRQNITLWNAKASRILGYRSDEVLGKPCHEVFCGCDADNRVICEPACGLITMAQHRQEPSTIELWCRTKSGTGVWINVSTIMAPFRHHQQCALIHLFREVTEQHEMIQAAKDFARVVTHGVEVHNNTSQQATDEIGELTQREKEILALLAEGYPGQAIAQKLHISTRTVRNHVTNILGKLRVHSRLEAVAWYTRRGFN